jgi:ATP-dependent Lhr-like helicase
VSLERFSPAVRAWFERSFSEPTPAQALGWPAIAAGEHTLISAPTGSGKTLAAFLWALDRLVSEPAPPPAERCRVLYVSPLRALAVDVERNLRAPLTGIALEAERLGLEIHAPTVAIRTGDTPERDRRDIARRPPDILITTPESLFLMLTSGAREILRSVRTVIVDEVHALAPNKRGAHLALSLERLERLARTPPQRIGLSATQRPLEEIARFLGGYADGRARPVRIVDAGHRRPMELTVEVPVEDMTDLSGLAAEPSPMPRLDGPATPGLIPSRGSIWPGVLPRLLELVRSHTSTIVFVNSRRLAERLAARLNELAGTELVAAHHGSIAREQRLLVEERLKRGALRGIVATSSLELGIDMGAVDLVVQVESPRSVARGLQRIGRSGHSVGRPARGVIVPTHRADLLEAAVVARRMREGEIEETRLPRNPLDVLAQQVVAMCAMEPWNVAELGALVRRAASFAELPEEALRGVLDMLAGRYPSEAFAELRPRIAWDRRTDTVRAREGAGRLAIANAGTIPDRGLYGVFTVDGRRVGELDEEMVHESRPGEVFVLGASSWRIEEVTPDRVVVSAAPGEPGKMPFWHGDGPGRPLELGRAIGEAVRELAELPERRRISVLRTGFGLDARAAANLAAYLREQQEATGALPDDRTIVLERFRDDIGDRRVCLLAPFGERVLAPWAIAIRARLAERLGADVAALWADDGIVIRLPEAEERMPLEDVRLDPGGIEDLVCSQLTSTALFTSVFREAAARALLLPRRRPGSRTPLWQQRRRAADLLGVALAHPDFPILLEATREVLRDVFDLPGLRQVLADLRARRLRLVAVDTDRPSPFARSLLFRWVGVYMYEDDAPAAERRAAALSLDRELLRELLGSEDLRELLDPEAIAGLERELQGLADGGRARDPDELHDLLRRVGALTPAELAARSEADPGPWVARLLREGRAIRVRVAGEERLAAAEDAARLRDGLGVHIPPGLPAALTEPRVESLGALEGLVHRYARTHGPFLAVEVAERLGAPLARVEAALAALERSGRVVRGAFRPGGAGTEWCEVEVLRRIRRRSLAALRREAEPVTGAALARFLLAWQHVQRPSAGPDALEGAIEQLQGARIPARILETEVLPARVRDFRSADLDALCAAGEVVWIGAGGSGPEDGRVALCFRGVARVLAPAPAPDTERPRGDIHQRLREHLAKHGASFWPDLLRAAGLADERAVLAALWDLVWAGEVTNDTLAPLRALLARRARGGGPAAPGGRGRPRGPLVAPLLEPAPSPTELAHARAMQLLDRHGVLTREAVLAEQVPGGFAALYPVLRALEEAGKVRRGAFVEGLGAAQFALPGALELLRDHRDPAPAEPLALAAADPAQPYGAALPWPACAGHPSRSPGAYVVLSAGEPAAYLERGGRTLLTFEAAAESDWPAALAALVKDGRVRRIELARIDGLAAVESPHAERLRAAGFTDGYRGLSLRG